jgi:formate-dependent phosphoribosylglycinamide formyltransferase (GAR transformylase)
MTEIAYSPSERRFLEEASRANLARLRVAVRISTVAVVVMVLLMVAEIILFVMPDPRDPTGWSTLSTTMGAAAFLLAMRAFVGMRVQAISIVRKAGLAS